MHFIACQNFACSSIIQERVFSPYLLQVTFYIFTSKYKHYTKEIMLQGVTLQSRSGYHSSKKHKPHYMNLNPPREITAVNMLKPKIKIFSAEVNRIELPATTGFIRFEEKKECYIWAHPDEICFVKSADHYVKSLIICGKEKKWMSRHCTLKELLDLLPPEDFIRLNKFYLLNRNHFSHIDENEKLLYFNDDSSIPVPHRISPYLRHLLKTTCT